MKLPVPLFCIAAVSAFASDTIAIDTKAVEIKAYFDVGCKNIIENETSEIWNSGRPLRNHRDYLWTPVGNNRSIEIHKKEYVILRRPNENNLWLLSVDGRDTPSQIYGPLQSYCSDSGTVERDAQAKTEKSQP
jgi:hypothetical protein